MSLSHSDFIATYSVSPKKNKSTISFYILIYGTIRARKMTRDSQRRRTREIDKTEIATDSTARDSFFYGADDVARKTVSTLQDF